MNNNKPQSTTQSTTKQSLQKKMSTYEIIEEFEVPPEYYHVVKQEAHPLYYLDRFEVRKIRRSYEDSESALDEMKHCNGWYCINDWN